MRLWIQSALTAPLLAPLCWLLSVALHACTTEVDLFRMHSRAAAGAGAATEISSSPSVLVERGAAPASVDMNCQPGHYVGAFGGTYNSAAWGNGSVPLSIAATPSMGRPGLEFWLEGIARDCRSDEEFCADFTVRGGKIRGFADPFSDGNAEDGNAADPLIVAVPFEIDFGGDLDCSRGKFRGLLQNGCYDVATVLFRFEGNAPADYEPASSSFTNGQWTVKEMPAPGAWFPPDANIGGMGSWEASLANDAVGPSADSAGLCDR